MAIYQAILSFGDGVRLSLFAETVGEMVDTQYTPAHTVDVRNDGTGVILLGNSVVAAGLTPNGRALRPGQSFRLSLHGGEALYAINPGPGAVGNIDVLIVLD